MPVASAELVLLALAAFVAVLATIARKLNIAYPIVMVIGGLALSLVPHLPHVRMDPDLVFLVILPPLLFSAAYQISWHDFKRNLGSIVMLAFGLVSFTVYGVAGISRWLIPGFDWHTGLVLGAVIAATDAIAATATAKRLGLPRRITQLLEAESLLNDGSGLVALRFTLALTLTGTSPSLVSGFGTLTYLVVMGVVIGLLAGFAVYRIQRYISDASVEITISLITPYLAYLTAEAAHCSGVMATLACGMYLARGKDIYSVRARVEGTAVWNTLDFVLNGLVFLVLGLQMPRILSEIQGVTTGQLISYGALFSAFVIALRMVCAFPALRLAGHSRKSAFLVGWAGMRGVLALAAAFSLPDNFPQRSMIIFLTFCVIFATLVLQGLSMPALILQMGLTDASDDRQALENARRHMTESALAKLADLRTSWGGKDMEVLKQAERFYRSRLTIGGISPLAQEEARLLRTIKTQLREAERLTAYQLCENGEIDNETLRALQYEIDIRDASEESIA